MLAPFFPHGLFRGVTILLSVSLLPIGRGNSSPQSDEHAYGRHPPTPPDSVPAAERLSPGLVSSAKCAAQRSNSHMLPPHTLIQRPQANRRPGFIEPSGHSSGRTSFQDSQKPRIGSRTSQCPTRAVGRAAAREVVRPQPRVRV